MQNRLQSRHVAQKRNSKLFSDVVEAFMNCKKERVAGLPNLVVLAADIDGVVSVHLRQSISMSPTPHLKLAAVLQVGCKLYLSSMR